MATVNLYVQGPFTIMLNFPAVPLFEETTAMPLYGSIYHPVIFMIGFKVIEGLGIGKALAGGHHRRAVHVLSGGAVRHRGRVGRHALVHLAR
ncbi:hypothetical protein [Mycobacterium sp. 94-17]|uniref:hypothetical protein n=1 Tax=Mycobacterium sp. 94-17 TaxID=2986147 RepID=UPI002D1E9FBE|nr:hypothetical protein [Mycobacterium sp. 94-17]MEB4209540.1 hypothetical protein [Mycobacterium sp. 94-17]